MDGKTNFKRRPTTVQIAADLGKLPPQAVELEELVLGAILADVNKRQEIIDSIVTPDIFYKDSNKLIYSEILSMWEKKKPIDIATLSIELKRSGNIELVGGPFYVAQLTSRVASAANVITHIMYLTQEFIKRKSIEIAAIASRDAYENTTDAIEVMQNALEALNELSRKFDGGFNTVTKITEATPKNEHPAVLSIKGIQILKRGNIAALIAPPGIGKSQLMEIICCSKINDEMTETNFGFRIHSDRRVALVDTERSTDDLKSGWERMQRRTGQNPDECIDFMSFRKIASYKDKKKRLFRMLESKEYDLIVCDGFGHMVGDVNNVEQSEGFVQELMAMVNSFNCAVFGTIHNNFKQQDRADARGHLGAAIMREAESYFAIKRSTDDRAIRIWTSNVGSNQKNRGGNDDIEFAYKWDSDRAMFMPTQYIEIPQSKKDSLKVIESVIAKVYSNYKVKRMFKADLIKRYADITSKSMRTSQRHITDCIGGFLIEVSDGMLEVFNEELPF